MQICPNADDIWLYFMTLMNNQKASIAGGRALFDINPNKQNSLWEKNKTGWK